MIKVEDSSSPQTGKSAVQHTTEGDSTERLSLLRINVAGELLQVIFGCSPNRMDGNYVEETIMSIYRFDA